MTHWRRATLLSAAVVSLVIELRAQQAPGPVLTRPANARNDYPNPYRTVTGWMKLPKERTMGSTSAVAIDRDGTSVWIVDRCSGNSLGRGGLTANGCKDSTLPPIFKFDSSGNLVRNFGAALMVLPHGMSVDRDGNVWVADASDNGTLAPRGVIPAGPGARATKGNQVFKFSPDGKLLLTLGKAGGAAEPSFFFQPNDVEVAPNGDIFVAEGHDGEASRILKFDKTGKLIKTFGKWGTGPAEFHHPHALAFDSAGRLFVGDRENMRIQILDQNVEYFAEWKQFGTPSGLYIDKNDVIYVTDSESQGNSPETNGYNPGVQRGIRIGSAKTGVVTAFIPDPEPCCRGSSASEGIAVDKNGVIYGAQVGLMDVKKYTKN
jgi:DNA-binding beta-propeller fold protein YncE